PELEAEHLLVEALRPFQIGDHLTRVVVRAHRRIMHARRGKVSHMARSEIEQFKVHVEDDVLEDLRRRLAATRFPDQIKGTGWEYGIPTTYVRELVDYWRDGYDWRAEEARLNEFDHFRTTIDGQSIHFVHARSSREDAFPLLFLHGWPGSVVEFLDVIPRLTDEFDVVVASLPGYG